MLFTVFQYIPILEEEVAAHGHVIQKKSTQNDSGDDNGNDQDDDNDDDSETDLDQFLVQGSVLLSISKQSYPSHHFFYASLKNSINTPPPKI